MATPAFRALGGVHSKVDRAGQFGLAHSRHSYATPVMLSRCGLVCSLPSRKIESKEEGSDGSFRRLNRAATIDPEEFESRCRMPIQHRGMPYTSNRERIPNFTAPPDPRYPNFDIRPLAGGYSAQMLRTFTRE